jgi:hypothetical protein
MPGAISEERPWRRSRIVVPVAQPAVATDWSVPVPAGHVWHLLAVQALLTADANAANRVPVLQLSDEGLVVVSIPVAANITANQAITVCWALGSTSLAFGSNQALPLPSVDLEPGGSVAVSTAAKQAGDQWSAVRLWVLDTTVRGAPADLAELPLYVVEVAGGLGG